MARLQGRKKAWNMPGQDKLAGHVRLGLLFCACGVVACLSGCGGRAPLLYVNGEAVSDAELGFLDQDVGETVRMKVLQQWAKESGVIQASFSLEKMLRQMEEENRDRVKQKAEGGIIYGVTEYSPLQYYRIQMGEYERALKDRMMEGFSVEELESWYQAHRENYRQIGEVTADVVLLEGGRVIEEGEVVLNASNYRTLSEQNEELVAVMAELPEGGEADWTDDRNLEWRVYCVSREADSYQPFEDVMGAVSEQYADEKLREELEERVNGSEVEDFRK